MFEQVGNRENLSKLSCRSLVARIVYLIKINRATLCILKVVFPRFTRLEKLRATLSLETNNKRLQSYLKTKWLPEAAEQDSRVKPFFAGFDYMSRFRRKVSTQM